MESRKILLPSIVVTEVTDSSDPNALAVSIPDSHLTNGGQYYIRPKLPKTNGHQSSGWLGGARCRFNLFPMILDKDGIPWAEANMWILDSLGSPSALAMRTYESRAEDLAAYKRFLDETQIDWLAFPAQKYLRPTYRFHGYLKNLIANAEVAPETAKRRMATVINFYRWLQESEVFSPSHSPWKEADRYVGFKDRHGTPLTKTVKTTDVSIKVAKQDNPYGDMIDDGGKLRPLPQVEQEWLIDALLTAGNTEITLIHLFGLLTGARLQTILTFQVKHVTQRLDTKTSFSEVRIPVGLGTGIDTKRSKQMVLHVPAWFYRMLRTYATSQRAVRRRQKATGGNTNNQYLFLTSHGAPFYTSQHDASVFDANSKLHHGKVGQALRQYIKEKIIPHIREKYQVPNFHYRFHDTRATFGMNLLDEKLKLVASGEETLTQVLNYVRVRMCHESLEVTERYLSYRSRLSLVHAAQDSWEAWLERSTHQLANIA